MTKLKIALNALILPFLAINFAVIAMDHKELVKIQFNQVMEKPFDHDTYQPKAPIRHNRIINGTYINYITKDTSQTTPNVIEIARQQILNEQKEITTILRQYTPQNDNEWNDATEQIRQSNARARTIKESANALQKNLNEDASRKKILSIKSAAQEIITSPFNHDQYKTTIKLTNPARIGYGDTDYINHLNSINIPAKQDDPLVTVKFRIEQNLQNVVDQQITEDGLKITKILNQLTPETLETYKLRREQFAALSERREKIYTSAKALWETSKLPWPPAIPAKYLDDNCSILNLNGNTPVEVTFNENKELIDLITKFKEKPTTLFCTLSEELATKIVSINEQTSQETREIIKTELFQQVTIKKEELKTNKLIKRRPRQDDDLQEFEPKLLPNSNVVEHMCNYHEHGKKSYSDKKRRNELIAGLNNNTLAFLNDRENGYKKRKLSTIENNIS